MGAYKHCPKDCPGGREESDCLGCEMATPFYKSTVGRFGVGQVKNLVNAMLGYYETARIDDVAILDLWDKIEIKDVARDYPSLKKQAGSIFQPHQKARAILTAAAYYWLRVDNRLENVITPLANYPELSCPMEVVERLQNEKRRLKATKASIRLPEKPRIKLVPERLTDAGLLDFVRCHDKLFPRGGNHKAKGSHKPNNSAVLTAKSAGTSPTRVKKARTVLRHGDEGTIAEIYAGRTTLNKAYKETPKKWQARIKENGKPVMHEASSTNTATRESNMKITCMNCDAELEVLDKWKIGIRGQSWSPDMLGQYSDNADYLEQNRILCACGQEQCPACWDPSLKTRSSEACQCGFHED